jgi:hypothetical protein
MSVTAQREKQYAFDSIPVANIKQKKERGKEIKRRMEDTEPEREKQVIPEIVHCGWAMSVDSRYSKDPGRYIVHEVSTSASWSTSRYITLSLSTEKYVYSIVHCRKYTGSSIHLFHDFFFLLVYVNT